MVWSGVGGGQVVIASQFKLSSHNNQGPHCEIRRLLDSYKLSLHIWPCVHY